MGWHDFSGRSRRLSASLWPHAPCMTCQLSPTFAQTRQASRVFTCRRPAHRWGSVASELGQQTSAIAPSAALPVQLSRGRAEESGATSSTRQARLGPPVACCQLDLGVLVESRAQPTTNRNSVGPCDALVVWRLLARPPAASRPASLAEAPGLRCQCRAANSIGSARN